MYTPVNHLFFSSYEEGLTGCSYYGHDVKLPSNYQFDKEKFKRINTLAKKTTLSRKFFSSLLIGSMGARQNPPHYSCNVLEYLLLRTKFVSFSTNHISSCCCLPLQSWQTIYQVYAFPLITLKKNTGPSAFF